MDPKTLTILKTWKAHPGSISDMDANSNFLVTCGSSPKSYGNQLGSQPDPLVKVFDLKALIPLPPVQFHGGGASHVRLHPRMLSTGMIVSRSGQLQTVDIKSGAMINVRHVNLVDAQLNGLEMAVSGEAFAAYDSSCLIQLWGSPSQLRFTNHSEPTEFADPPSTQESNLDWVGTKPLNSIGMPYYREELLSKWPNNLLCDVGLPPQGVDPDILSHLAQIENISFTPNLHKTPRNLTPSRKDYMTKNGSAVAPVFLSDQTKEGAELVEHVKQLLKADPRAKYWYWEIQYSKYGVEDYNFE